MTLGSKFPTSIAPKTKLLPQATTQNNKIKYVMNDLFILYNNLLPKKSSLDLSLGNTFTAKIATAHKNEIGYNNLGSTTFFSNVLSYSTKTQFPCLI